MPHGTTAVLDRRPALEAATLDVHDQRQRSLDMAHGVLLVHVPDEHGFCAGCLDGARLAAAPCPVTRRAVCTIETHGAVQWDQPVAGRILR